MKGTEMKKKSFFAVSMLVLLLSLMLETRFFLVPVKADPRTISVPDEYPTIQDAINAASPGDVILVDSETYHENVVINISLTLMGAGDSTTFIHGDGKEPGIEIIADNVNISGFTILNCVNGIKIPSNGNTVINNTITLNVIAGIYVEFSDGNTLIGNTIALNDFVGVYLKASSKNKISGNTITNNNDTGILLEGQSSSNVISNNTITSIPFYGVSLYNSGNNIISDNLISSNDTGIDLFESSGNFITGNTISNDKYYSIDLIRSSGNFITGNTISNNRYYGIDLFESSSNTFYHNNLVDNYYQVASDGTTNTWDNGAEGNYWSDYTGEDLNGDGIGDTPYQGIDMFPLMEPWSLFRVFNIVSNGTPYIVTVFSNSTIANFNFSQSLEQISFNITGPSDTLGFCNVTIPKNLINSDPPSKVWTVTVDGTYASFTLTENSTHSSLQFTLSHSTRRVQIRVIGIQNIPPQADFTFSPIDPTLYDTIDFNDTSTDSDGEIASWDWEFGDGNSSTDQNPSYKYADAGKYVVTLTVEDNLTATTVTSKVVSVRKVGTTLTIDAPSTVIQGDPLMLTAILRDEYENSLPYAMVEFYLFEEEWVDIGSAETNNSGVASITYASSQVVGTQRFKAVFPGTQIFAESSSICTIEILVIVDVDLPEADAGPDQSVHVGTPVIFNASGSSDNVGVVSYEWDFGDGTTSTGVIVNHTYTESGTYTVTLTVKDAADNGDTDTVIVIVKADPYFPIWIVCIIVAAGIIAVAGLFIWKRKEVDK